MRIFGLDFTSAPTARKPITCVTCELHARQLHVLNYHSLASFTAFEAWLESNGPWIAALDFPFGQPRKLIQHLDWPTIWTDYISQIAALGKTGFEETLASYRASRAVGDKLHLRAVDRLAGACSPMMLHRVPVGKMFFQGAPRLLSTPISILPCRPTPDTRIVIEGYPALVARSLIGNRSYKSDERKQQTAIRTAARQSLVDALRSDSLINHYGMTPVLSDELAQQLVQEPMADGLDALLCSIQAAWAWTQREYGYGIPATCDVLEGWIVDPHMY